MNSLGDEIRQDELPDERRNLQCGAAQLVGNTVDGKLAVAAIVVLCAYGAPHTAVPFINGKRIYETDTHYKHCLVYEAHDRNSHRPTVSLVIDRWGRQSSIFTDKNDDLVLEYLKSKSINPKSYAEARNECKNRIDALARRLKK